MVVMVYVHTVYLLAYALALDHGIAEVLRLPTFRGLITSQEVAKRH